MKKIAWIADTTATLSSEFVQKHNIHVISLNIIFGDEVYREEKDINMKEFYEKMSVMKSSPSTSQPTIGDFLNLYEELKKEYDMGIAFHPSSELSGTYSTSVQAAEMAGFELIAIDSRIGSYPLTKMVESAVTWHEEGKSVKEIVSKVKGMAERTELYLVPSNLDQLKKSGRLSNAQAILGAILKINLVIKFDQGKVVMSEKIRTEKKVKAFFVDLVNEASQQTNEVCVIHADDEAKALEWKQEIEKLHPNLHVRTMMLCSVAGVHTGRGTIALGWVKN